MSNSFKLCPTDFSRGAKIFLGGACTPGYGPASKVSQFSGTKFTGKRYACKQWRNMKVINNWWQTSIALRSSTLSGGYKNQCIQMWTSLEVFICGNNLFTAR